MENLSHTATAYCFNNLSDFLTLINEQWKKRWGLENPGLCFRGMESSSYDLNPSILRSPYPDNPNELAKLENSLWVEFRLRSKPLLGKHVSNAWEALLIMQQYGFPTRLLDWSRSLAVATYFAVRNLDNKDTDGVVWLMAARHLMEIRGVNGAWRTVIGDPSIEKMGLRINEDNLDQFLNYNPIAISPDQIVSRMIVQRGIYTLHTFKKHAIENLAIADFKNYSEACFLHKIIIPAQAKKSIKSELSIIAGISEETIFPDIEGFARNFVSEFKDRN